MFKVLNGDCVSLMTQEWSESFALVFADPPFNQGDKYVGFDDRQRSSVYQAKTTEWIEKAWECVAPGGVLALHGSIALLPNYSKSLNDLWLWKYFETQLVWHYRFGQCGYSNFVNGHCNCLILRKPGVRKWYADSILVPSDRATKYKDKRATAGVRSGSRPPSTVWGIPSDGAGWGRVTGTSKERWEGHPNQLPINYIRRVVLAYTTKDDRVLDPFCGSGTVGLVCKHEDRSYVGIDISSESAASAQERIEAGYYPEFGCQDDKC